MNLTPPTYFWLSLFLLAFISLFIRRPFTLLIARPFYPPVLRSHSSYIRIHFIISAFWALVYGANALLVYQGIKGPWPYGLLALGFFFSFTAPKLFLWVWIKTGRGSRVPRRWLKSKSSRQLTGCAVTPQYLENLEQAKKELSQSFKDKCDVAVVGGGIGGLTAAAILAQKGYEVQVFEQHSLPGGYCTAFKRNGYTFDAAVLSITGLEGSTGEAWKEAGVEGVEWIQHPLFGRIITPDKAYDIPQGLDAQEEYFCRHFPQDSKGVKSFYGVLREIKAALHGVPSMPETVRAARDFIRQHPTAFKYMGVGWQVLLDEYLENPKIKALLSFHSTWLGVPPGMAVVPNMTTIQAGGVFYPQGGMQKVPEALVAAIRAKGGAVHLQKSVSRIILDNGRAAGIELAEGVRVAAKTVLYAADIRALAYKLLGREYLHPVFLNYLEELTYSPSAFMVYLGVNGSLQGDNLSPAQALCGGYDAQSWYQQILEGKTSLDDCMGIYTPTLLDPSLAPFSHHTVCLLVFAPYKYGEPWKEVKMKTAQAVIQRAEKAIPGLSQAVEVMEAATPLTLERYTKNYCGANYGLAQIPEQMGTRRLPHKTPIPGLYLAGHNTFPGAGVQGAAVSGWLAAGQIEKNI